MIVSNRAREHATAVLQLHQKIAGCQRGDPKLAGYAEQLRQVLQRPQNGHTDFQRIETPSDRGVSSLPSTNHTHDDEAE